ncbi:hypothetical protein PR048_008574 [Dryococelus australis]|uniref:Transposable element P transposase-like RNase H domain-containing protein n=1 Tax=Dryococelus australis TaxID=614101 RepID=A0ABQ9HXH0_9NEOP|nr:hypothetical protein PR048_008574 [Dryococelus australis]
MCEGLLHHMFQYPEVARSKLNTKECIKILQFDEVKVKRSLEYDVKKEEVVSPFLYMQVVMAQGLFSKWKQPVYVNFDTKMRKDILESIIIKLHGVGYVVKVIISNLGGRNVCLWKEMRISTEKTFFNHPSAESEKMYLFTDPSHLLKLIRNWFLDTGLMLPDYKGPVAAFINAEKS